jgi:predicted transcriptional regulator of viral defense system
MVTQSDQLMALARQTGALRARDLDAHHIPRVVLSRLVKQGALLRVDRGLYLHPEAEVTEHHTLVEVAQRLPRGVVNLLSALSFHGLTDEAPHEVWLALPRNARVPRLSYPPLQLSWCSPSLLVPGVETHRLEGVPVRVTGPARTVADVFKYRRRVGQEVALTALRDYLRLHRGGREELWRMAELCRVHNVLRPYLEVLS